MSTIPLKPGIYYHIHNRGNNKENIFKEDRNYLFFLTKVKKYLLDISDIYAYCLMPNHFHLVSKIKTHDALPSEYQTGKKRIHQPFSNLFNAYTKAINKATGRTGSLFQEHFGRHVINDEKYLQNIIMYVHLNAVKHGFTDDYRKYKHSSYHSLISEGHTHLQRHKVMDLFGDKESFIFCHQAQQYHLTHHLNEIENEDC
ncbi:transposase [Carboxylicivirga marina]|uniref:transposase n=1 Tax=Carboxylicivirga marina TaxID=2800988 RepID=UPI002593343A|nr:transposase [uncultured Carboxylicivirga sp.]